MGNLGSDGGEMKSEIYQSTRTIDPTHTQTQIGMFCGSANPKIDLRLYSKFDLDSILAFSPQDWAHMETIAGLFLVASG